MKLRFLFWWFCCRHERSFEKSDLLGLSQGSKQQKPPALVVTGPPLTTVLLDHHKYHPNVLDEYRQQQHHHQRFRPPYQRRKSVRFQFQVRRGSSCFYMNRTQQRRPSKIATMPKFPVSKRNTKMTKEEISSDPSEREDLKPFMVENEAQEGPMDISNRSAQSLTGEPEPLSQLDLFFIKHFPSHPDFFKQAFKLFCAFTGLQASYLTWGYMQELIMTTVFEPTDRVPDGKFPSAAFCVFSNRFLAVIVALVVVRMKHGTYFGSDTAPLLAFTPCALSNTISSWSQYASLKYVSFPVQTVFKSSKIIPVMCMGKILKGTSYPYSQYAEAALITIGVAIFSVLSKESDKGASSTELVGLIFLIMYITSDSFTSQWQSRIYADYGKENVDPYQMMLGVNVNAIMITTAGLVLSGDLPVVWEFLLANPVCFRYNIITAITSASGQLCIFYTIKEFGPIVFTIIMTTRQMFSICLSAIVFGHVIKPVAAIGAIIVFGVLFYQIYYKYQAKTQKNSAGRSG